MKRNGLVLVWVWEAYGPNQMSGLKEENRWACVLCIVISEWNIMYLEHLHALPRDGHMLSTACSSQWMWKDVNGCLLCKSSENALLELSCGMDWSLNIVITFLWSSSFAVSDMPKSHLSQVAMMYEFPGRKGPYKRRISDVVRTRQERS